MSTNEYTLSFHCHGVISSLDDLLNKTLKVGDVFRVSGIDKNVFFNGNGFSVLTLRKALHFYLGSNYPSGTFVTFNDTDIAINNSKSEIHTTQLCFLSFRYIDDYDLFVHDSDGKVIQLVIGKNKSTDRFLREFDDLERLLIAGEFDFEKGNINNKDGEISE